MVQKMENLIEKAKNETTQDSNANESKQDDNGDILFDAESEKLTSSAWFNPKPGTHEVTFLNNGKKETRTYGKGEDKEEREVGVFKVEVDGDELNWSVTVGKSEVSLWGQLMKVGKARDDLKGETITLIRQGKKQDTNYTVQEAAAL